jgi:hypothetical protein
MRHGIQMDLTHAEYGGDSGMRIEVKFFSFDYDDEKLLLYIEKPTWEYLDYYDCYELTSPHDDIVMSTVNNRCQKKIITHQDIPIDEW